MGDATMIPSVAMTIMARCHAFARTAGTAATSASLGAIETTRRCTAMHGGHRTDVEQRQSDHVERRVESGREEGRQQDGAAQDADEPKSATRLRPRSCG